MSSVQRYVTRYYLAQGADNYHQVLLSTALKWFRLWTTIGDDEYMELVSDISISDSAYLPLFAQVSNTMPFMQTQAY